MPKRSLPRNSPREPSLYRALDANCNRAREGFRVAEDVARFILEDPALTRRLKALRHGVTAAERALFRGTKDRMAFRDVDDDPGKGNRVTREGRRSSPLELLKVNLKRAQEALRSLEEFSKLAGHPVWRRFKRLRYECYRLEEDPASPPRR